MNFFFQSIFFFGLIICIFLTIFGMKCMQKKIEANFFQEDGVVLKAIKPRNMDAGPPNITELMMIQLSEIPIAPRPPWNVNSWAKYIKEQYNNQFIQQFYDRLSDLPDEQLIQVCLNLHYP